MSKPVVDGLQQDLRGQAAVLRLDLLSGVGRKAAAQFDVKAVPTMLVFDGSGQLIFRSVGNINAGAIRAKIAELGD